MPHPGSAPALKSHPVAADAPLFVVLNVGSGKYDTATVQAAIETKLTQSGRTFSVHLVSNAAGSLDEVARQVVERARAAGGIVVAAGGDGTIHTVAQATLGSGCPFGVLPLGTFNYFSRAHGIPSNVEGACDVLLGLRAYEVQVGMLNDHVFLVNASLGLYPQLLEDRENVQRRLGRSRFISFAAAIATLLKPHRKLRLDIESSAGKRTLATPTLFVGNNRLQLEQVGLAETSLVEQRRLVGVALNAVGVWALLRVAARALLGHLKESGEITSFAFARMIVRPRVPGRRIKAAMDGEVMWVTTPLTFRVAPESLLLLRPEHAVEDPG